MGDGSTCACWVVRDGLWGSGRLRDLGQGPCRCLGRRTSQVKGVVRPSTWGGAVLDRFIVLTGSHGAAVCRAEVVWWEVDGFKLASSWLWGRHHRSHDPVWKLVLSWILPPCLVTKFKLVPPTLWFFFFFWWGAETPLRIQKLKNDLTGKMYTNVHTHSLDSPDFRGFLI